MEVVGRIKDSEDGKPMYQVVMSENELDRVTGIAGKPHQTGRYTPGLIFNISRIYKRLSKVVKQINAIKLKMAETRAAAQAIEDSLPIIPEE